MIKLKYIGGKYKSDCFLDEKYKYDKFLKDEIKEVCEVRAAYLLETFPGKFKEIVEPTPIVEEKILPVSQDKMLRNSRKKEVNNGTKCECLNNSDIL